MARCRVGPAHAREMAAVHLAVLPPSLGFASRPLHDPQSQWTNPTRQGKTRLVPFRTNLAQALRDYLAEPASIVSINDDGPLLVRNSGAALRVGVASEAIRRLLRKLVLKPLHGRQGLRPYDLRHAFAVDD